MLYVITQRLYLNDSATTSFIHFYRVLTFGLPLHWHNNICGEIVFFFCAKTRRIPQLIETIIIQLNLI